MHLLEVIFSYLLCSIFIKRHTVNFLPQLACQILLAEELSKTCGHLLVLVKLLCYNFVAYSVNILFQIQLVLLDSGCQSLSFPLSGQGSLGLRFHERLKLSLLHIGALHIFFDFQQLRFICFLAQERVELSNTLFDVGIIKSKCSHLLSKLLASRKDLIPECSNIVVSHKVACIFSQISVFLLGAAVVDALLECLGLLSELVLSLLRSSFTLLLLLGSLSSNSGYILGVLSELCSDLSCLGFSLVLEHSES